MKLLVVFLDGFHPDYFDHPAAPTIAQLARSSARADLEPVLGFSNANKVSLFTGTRPDEHEQWSYFQYAPDASPFRTPATSLFRWIDSVPSELMRKGAKFALSKTYVRAYGRSKGYANLSWENVPIGLLKHFDHTEKDLVKGVGVPSLFTIAQAAGLKAKWVNIPWHPRAKHLAHLDRTIAENDVVVMYNANMDAAGHWFAPAPGRRFDQWLERTDALVASAQASARRHWGEGHEVLMVSDHGMAKTERHVDLQRRLRRIAGHGERFVPFIDSTMARFWFPDPSAEREVRAVVEGLGHGRWLGKDDARALGVDFSHARYGEAIWLLDTDTAFYPAYVSWVRPRGMHGYDPRHETQTAILTSTAPGGLPRRAHAVDVLPTMLRALGLPSARPEVEGIADAIDGGGHDHHGHGH